MLASLFVHPLFTRTQTWGGPPMIAHTTTLHRTAEPARPATLSLQALLVTGLFIGIAFIMALIASALV